MLPSFYLSNGNANTWSIARAAVYGAGIGAVAALLRTLGPSHGPFGGSISSGGVLPILPEIAVAALGFGALCVVAAMLRNFIAQKLIWPENNR
jgi:hypothetical protein